MVVDDEKVDPEADLEIEVGEAGDETEVTPGLDQDLAIGEGLVGKDETAIQEVDPEVILGAGQGVDLEVTLEVDPEVGLEVGKFKLSSSLNSFQTMKSELIFILARKVFKKTSKMCSFSFFLLQF